MPFDQVQRRLMLRERAREYVEVALRNIVCEYPSSGRVMAVAGSANLLHGVSIRDAPVQILTRRPPVSASEMNCQGSPNRSPTCEASVWMPCISVA